MANVPIATILIIDDVPEDRDVYRRFLLRDNPVDYQIAEAESGEEGLAYLQTSACDLILLDVRLPDMDGLAVLAELQQNPQLMVPIIMLTGMQDVNTAVQAMKQGVQDYLIKSQVTPEVLRLTVRNALQRANLQNQLSQSQQRQAGIAAIALRIRQTLDLDSILNRAAIEMHKLLNCDRMLIYKCAPDMSGTIVAASVHDRWSLSLHQNIIHTCFRNDAAYRQGEQCVINDVRQAERSAGHRDLLQQFGVQANLSIPVLLTVQPMDGTPPVENCSKTQLWGLLIAHQCDQPRVWQADEIELVQALSVQLALAIQQAELLHRTKTALQRESELNTLKSHIVSTISHEYRSPLATILIAATTLISHQHQLPTAKQNKFLNLIALKARHLSNLVDDMLFMNQMEQGQVPVKFVPVDLAQFISERIEEYRTQAPEHQLEFVSNGDVQAFHTDPKILGQILNNLLSNSIKYSPTGCQIDVQLYGQDAQVILVVQDQGIGIPLEDQTTLFEPFHRGSNVGTISGTGLGLSIIKSCTEMLGGNVACQSQIAQGTRMTIGLPKVLSEVALAIG
ncbi:response regulator [filamentous cyanobacterium LEGE 11480]|uniref:histidine kinase n=1 Tax=Romeriopsis navalis LEGE 11480 TaxID=2777977 RepID=A0A928VKN0_9CYAN|nr:ATP-binding protein [Romeriopsis navalis]MBE9030343.1 response regulator [Romeriopsis navalis LEGE 11480]